MYIRIKLNELLRSKGISNRGFANMTGISRNVINKYCNNETDHHIPLDNLAKMCKYLNCGITDILELVREDGDGFIFTFPEEELAEHDNDEELITENNNKPT